LETSNAACDDRLLRRQRVNDRAHRFADAGALSRSDLLSWRAIAIDDIYDLPSAAEGAVEIDEIGRDLGVAVGKIISRNIAGNSAARNSKSHEVNRARGRQIQTGVAAGRSQRREFSICRPRFGKAGGAASPDTQA
jgi:hypothetical protein